MLLKLLSYKFLFLALFFTQACSHAAEKRQWPKEIKQDFLVPLTYPDSEWSAKDFGKSPTIFEKQLLQKFLPQVFVDSESFPPIDFYSDYLPYARLHDFDGNIEKGKVDRQQLKRYERTAGYYLDYRGEFHSCRKLSCSKRKSPIYGRVFYESMDPPQGLSDLKPQKIIVLKYNLVFAASGLPKDLPWYKNLGASIAGNRSRWHELDIHGAIHIFLRQETKKPFLLLLAQHNHFSSYLLGKDIPFDEKSPLQICMAQRSNEPYPCHRGEKAKSYNTVGNPKNYGYVLTGSGAFWDGAQDIVSGPQSGGVKVPLALEYLPSKDPLYVSWIPLGDKKKIFGLFESFYREGPPGININTWPQLKKYSDIAQFWYFDDEDEVAQGMIETAMGDFFHPKIRPLLRHNGERLWRALVKE